MTSRVAIIGGGFSGVMTAVNLARLGRRPLHITIINGQRPLGRGVAYATRRAEHLLNVAARNMSAFPNQPDHFWQWLRTRSEYDAVPTQELRERFIPRMIYGDYLRSIMQHHLQAADGLTPVTAEFIDDEATDIEPDGVIHLADGGRTKANRIVLACGNEAPAELPGAETLSGHPAWIGNPWRAWDQKLPAHGGSIVLLGAGLTTVDAILTLRALGWQGVIHAISRHGWLPHAHFRGIEYPDFPPPGVDLAELGLEKLIALLELHCARLRDLGANPAIIVDKMRPHTQRIWQGLSLEERTLFVRAWAARWNVLRHRIAPEIHAQIASAELTGQLQVHAAGILRVAAAENRVRVFLSNGNAIDGDLVINATGPQSRFSATRSALLQNLLRRGLITCDDLDMGVRVDADHTVIEREGGRSRLLLALGPLLRGTLWESIAVPELRSQARHVAETLLDQPVTPATEAAVMMEYMI
ncbi:MAG: FAD/NAD(P)-binding protein [Chthoniobacter sp.]|nr:FAD/NAD(P)-binding protein [Chthoniobacter sp.]